jgi:hypothetical protein
MAAVTPVIDVRVRDDCCAIETSDLRMAGPA